jgi:hypothetical protein
VTFITDSFEAQADPITGTNDNEELLSPSGTIGFHLTYFQLSCSTTV